MRARLGFPAFLVPPVAFLHAFDRRSFMPSLLLPPMVLLRSKGDFESFAAALGKEGVRALAPASVVGRSGVKHEFAFATQRKSGSPGVVIDTELSLRDVDEMKILKFYVKVFDVGPEKAILCVSPKLSERAAELAREYGIVVLEDEAPRKLVVRASGMVREALKGGTI